MDTTDSPRPNWLTHLYLYGQVRLVLDTRNAVPAFTPPARDGG